MRPYYRLVSASRTHYHFRLVNRAGGTAVGGVPGLFRDGTEYVISRRAFWGPR